MFNTQEDMAKLLDQLASGDLTEEQLLQSQASLATDKLHDHRWVALGTLGGAWLGYSLAGFLGSAAAITIGGAIYLQRRELAEKAEQQIQSGSLYEFLPKEYKIAYAQTYPNLVTDKQKAALAKQGIRIDGYQPPSEPAKAANLHPDTRQTDTNKPMNPADRARLAIARDLIHNTVDQYRDEQVQLGHSVGQKLANIPREFAQGMASAIPQVQPVQPQITFDDGAEYEWTNELLAHNAIALFGAQGGGKTSKAGWILAKRVEQGAFAAVLDPFAAAANWKGLTVFGRGSDFRGIEKALAKFTAEAKSRINKRAFNENYSPFNDTHWHFMLDEMTNWEKNVDPDVMGAFVDTCSQNLRQCNMSVTFCTHGDTLACIGGGAATRGKADLLKRQFLWLQVLPVADANVPGGLRCSGEAILRREGGDEKVSVPEWMQAPTGYDYRAYNPIQAETTTIAQQVNQQPTATAPIQQPLQPQADIESYRPDWWGDKSRRLFQWQTSNTLAKSGLSKSNIIKKMQDFKSEQYRGFASALAELEEEFGKLSNQ